MSSKSSKSLVKHVAKLANIPISKVEEQELETAFAETLKVVDKLADVDVSGTEPTHQVTGLENVTRPDVVNKDVMFSQPEALKNARKAHDGYFVVPRVLEEKDV